LPGKDFLEMLQETGFLDVELVQETEFNASPKTKGVLLRARKPETLDAWKKEPEQIKTKFKVKQKSVDTKSGSD
jgi:hypothetical protein